MNKNTHFFGQPVISQLLSYIKKHEVLQISRQYGGERYVKKFNGWEHFVTMLYAVISKMDSLREIELSMSSNYRYLNHLSIKDIPRRSTLSDANKRRSETIFQEIYMKLYNRTKNQLISDSGKKKTPKWFDNLKIIDSTTISLFSNLIFKGVGRNPLRGKKKGGIKVHTVIHANENVPSDICFTSAATHDNFMLAPEKFSKDDILAMDRAYVDYFKMQQLTEGGVIYVTKMKENLRFKIIRDTMYQQEEGKMKFREQIVIFSKRNKNPDKHISHKARIVTYIDTSKKEEKQIIRLVTNDFELSFEDIIGIYNARWEIESLFKQLKQNFPLKYFYGESANAIKIQIWCTLIANLLISLLKSSSKQSWSFSNLATLVRILLMSYIDIRNFIDQPEKERLNILKPKQKAPPNLFDFAY